MLAGGASSRMGFDKAMARLGQGTVDDGITLVARAVTTARSLSADVLLVVKDADSYADLAVRIVRDVYPGAGSLGGIYSGLLAAKYQHSLVVACDMPFLSLPLWRHMLGLPRDYDALVPRSNEMYEPLHAVYSKGCLPAMRKMLERGRLRVTGFLDQVQVRFLDEDESSQFDPEHWSFFNVNTPEELTTAVRRWSESTAGKGEKAS